MDEYEPYYPVFNRFGECINGAESLSRSAQAFYNSAIKIGKLTPPQTIKIKKLDEV
jgi:hypothetical protein